ncbi:MAG TPA: hypothetical protein VHG89_06875 [Verrucomicrobiae bacterium]|nr:hypothetical protein [Verrucomicrobiae bacterium]
MKYVWQIINVSLVILAAFGGYSSMSPDKLKQMNPDIIFCTIILAMMPVFAVGTVFYSIRSGKGETLPRPSWNRHGLNWWYDPLQSLFISNFVIAGLAIGSALCLPKTTETGFWLFASYCCMTVGLLIGQILVYRIFRSRIVAAK